MYERRRATRMRAPPDQDQVILRLRGRDVISRLRDESAHGMAVCCDGSVELQAGDTLKIRTVVGWFEAKVIRVSPSPEGVVVGLTRGGELLREKDYAVASAGVSRWALVAALGVGLLAVPLVTLYWPKSEPKRPASAKAPTTNNSANKSKAAASASAVPTAIPVRPANRRPN